jgi:hypothetical protein
MGMPVKLAEYGFGVFGMGLIAWSLVTIVVKLVDRFAPAPRAQAVIPCPAIDLAKLVEASTRSTTELIQLSKLQIDLIKQLTGLVKELADDLREMRLDAARQQGRAVS